MPPSTLVIVAATLPHTSGQRTRRRCQLACEILGADRLIIANLLNQQTSDVTQLSIVGREAGPWLASRPMLSGALAQADQILLAYGLSEPTGKAKSHWRRQKAWLRAATEDRGLLSLVVGDGPRHPSRWQRFTARHHPGVHFREALGASLVPFVDEDLLRVSPGH